MSIAVQVKRSKRRAFATGESVPLAYQCPLSSLEKLSNDEDLRYLAEIIVIINRDSAVEQE